MQSRKKVLIKLFVSTLYLSAFTFGGGYVIVTLMKKKFVDEYHWIEAVSYTHLLYKLHKGRTTMRFLKAIKIYFKR